MDFLNELLENIFPGLLKGQQWNHQAHAENVAPYFQSILLFGIIHWVTGYLSSKLPLKKFT